MDKHTILRETSFGHRVAEDEVDVLASYFVETDDWSRLYRGDIDIVYGAKGAGKSAFYALLLSKADDLFDKNVLIIPAENPRGAPAFRDLLFDPPATEREFVNLWKLYFACLLHGLLVEYGIGGEAASQLELALQREGLVRGGLSLAGVLSSVFNYIRRALRPQAVEGCVNVDPVSQLPTGFTGKIVFSEPGKGSSDPEIRSVDRLIELANIALTNANRSSWILLDRLDVAFSENTQLEANALRALFRVYLDFLAFPQIHLKIFLRLDIWARITAEGFREASHVTRHLTISWNRNSLLNLVVRRAIHNRAICAAYDVTVALGRAPVAEQEELFYRAFPDQVDVGPNKSSTLDWLLSRTRDGTKVNAPRELIHFLNCLRDVQVKRFELGDAPFPEKEQLFARLAFKEALPEVSRVRLQQTLYAEHPGQQPWLEKLRGEKTLQTPETLAQVWNESAEDATQRATSLANIGFFERRGTKQSPEYWVPFLYREALELVQGTAE